MEIAKACSRHGRPMLLVLPLGLLGILPALTLLFVAFGLLIIAGWLADELVKRTGLGMDSQAGIDATGGLSSGPTRW